MKLGSLLACPLIACAACNTGDTIRESHYGDIYPTLRLTHGMEEPEAPGQSPPAEIELQVSRADDSAGLLDYELLQVAGAVRWNLVHDDKATLGLYLGLAFDHNQFDVGAPYDVSDGAGHLGLLVGARFGYRIVSRVELYARMQAVQYVVEAGTSDQLEIGASVRLSDAVSAFVAWRQWNVSVDEFDSLQIDEIDLDTEGIAFGFEFWL